MHPCCQGTASNRANFLVAPEAAAYDSYEFEMMSPAESANDFMGFALMAQPGFATNATAKYL